MDCIKCGKYFNIRVKINGKFRNLNNRKYCLECSPFGKHNTKRIHLKQGETFKKCHVCQREYPRARHQCKNLCGTCSVNRYRTKLKREMVEMKGGSCSICGYSKCIAALEFHHLDPLAKEIQISGSTKNRNKLLKEAGKCILVCVRCHREIHSEVVQR